MLFYLCLFWIKKIKEKSPDKRNKFAHFFNGVSPNTKSQLYIAILQIRRALFVTLLIFIGPISSTIIIIILAGFQSIYLLILIIIRPFELIKCNIIEIVNELYFLTMLASLLKFNSIESWKGTPTTIYTMIESRLFKFILNILIKDCYI